MVLEAVYEQDFLDCSYGFRPGRSAHQALDASLAADHGNLGGGWIVEVDIRKFFDTLDHAHLRELLRRRVRDGVLLRLIGKWLNAGVLEEGSLSFPESGAPQGGVMSPLLANVYLHYVLDVWFEHQVKPCLKGRAFLIRYADDFVMGFACEEDARRVLEVLPQRFGKYGLAFHPDKTRLVPFRATCSGPTLRRLGWRDSTGDFRPARFHPLLGSFAERVLGGEAANGPGSPEPGAQEDCPMVSAQPAPAACGAAPDAEPETTRSLRLLRDHWQQHCVVGISERSATYLAEMAVASPTMRLPFVDDVQAVVGALPASGRACRPFGVPSGRSARDLTSRMR